ncbi:MAG: HEAT repeat domain-containing protein [Acidobacteriia bacterium]|nr:HEAT repeat domain-containing protein [Terriglobia bacterium]
MSYFFVLPIAALVALLLLARTFWRRPITRWIVSGAVGGAAAVAVLTLYGIFHSTSSTAAIGILFVPFAMVFGGAAGAVVGFAAFHAVHVRERMRQGVRAGALAAASMALLAFGFIYAFHQARRIQAFHRYQQAENPEALAAAAEENRAAKDTFLLSAIAANAKTPTDSLLRIARDPDPALHHKRREWINMFDRDQLAVMRKVVRNPNSPVETLVILAASPDDYVLADVCADKRTPEAILRHKCAPNDSYLVHWSLAGNPSAPVDLLEALPRTKDKYVAHGLAYNPNTPLPVLRELAKHEDPLVRQGVAVNPSADTTLLTELSRDPVDYVSRAAVNRLQRKSP